MLGSVCALVAVWLLLVGMRGALDEERAFRAAAGCVQDDGAPAGGPSDGRAADCLRTVAARIDRSERVRSEKTPVTRLRLTEADGTSSRVRLEGLPEEVPAAGAGGRVEVTYWRGEIRYVDFASERRYTPADPRGGHRAFGAWGLGLGFAGAGFLWASLWWARYAHVSVRAYPWQFTVPFAGALCLAATGAFAPWLTGGPGEAFGLVGLCVPVVLAGCAVAALVVRRRQRGDDTIALSPAVPVGERFFPGQIWGEVPYACGAGDLAAGPARLVAIPPPRRLRPPGGTAQPGAGPGPPAVPDGSRPRRPPRPGSGPGVRGRGGARTDRRAPEGHAVGPRRAPAHPGLSVLRRR